MNVSSVDVIGNRHRNGGIHNSTLFGEHHKTGYSSHSARNIIISLEHMDEIQPVLVCLSSFL